MAKKWRVEGTVVVKDGSGNRVDPYTAEFTLSEDDKQKAQAIIRRGYIADYLRKDVQGYKRVRTCMVVGGKSVKEHEADELEEAISEAVDTGALPENLDAYGGSEEKAEAVKRSVSRKKKAEAKKRAQKNKQVEDHGYID